MIEVQSYFIILVDRVRIRTEKQKEIYRHVLSMTVYQIQLLYLVKLSRELSSNKLVV